MDRDQVVSLLKASKPIVRDRFKVELVGLFGSYARNQHHAKSDLDLLYQPLEGASFGLAEVIALENYIKELVKVNSVDLVDRDYINPVIALEIQDELVYV
ncbi:MAG: nucleotidyltransferase domain-containing protein [Bacteroidota bacterium]